MDEEQMIQESSPQPCGECDGTGFVGLSACPRCAQTGITIDKDAIRGIAYAGLLDALDRELASLQPDKGLKHTPVVAGMLMVRNDISEIVDKTLGYVTEVGDIGNP